MKPILACHGDPVAALAARAQDGPERQFMPPGRTPVVVLDAVDVPAGMRPSRIEFRRDVVISRRRWQFAVREEAVLHWESGL